MYVSAIALERRSTRDRTSLDFSDQHADNIDGTHPHFTVVADTGWLSAHAHKWANGTNVLFVRACLSRSAVQVFDAQQPQLRL